MNKILFSRGITHWLEEHNLYIIANKTLLSFSHSNLLFNNILPNYTDINMIHKIDGVFMLFTDSFIYVYKPCINSNTYIPKLIHCNMTSNITSNNSKIIQKRIGVKSNNILTIYKLSDDYSLEEQNKLSFDGKIIDFSEKLIILETASKRNLVFNINTREPLVSNYLNPNIIIELNENVYLIDSFSGVIMSFDVNNLIVKKLTTVPGFVVKAIVLGNDIALILNSANVNLENSTLLHILQKNNIQPINGIMIFDTTKNSIRYSITGEIDNIDYVFLTIGKDKITMLEHTDKKLHDYISFTT